MATSIEPFAEVADEDHPIQWEAAGGNEVVRFVTWKEAIRRLGNYGYGEWTVREALTRGELLRTDFAFYKLAVPAAATT